MPVAHLICGYIGSGKTTFARQLEVSENAIRFTHDEWMVDRYGHNPPADKFQDYYKDVSASIWQEALDQLDQGRDVILDFGFWKRVDRDDARAKTSAYEHRFYVVVCDSDVAWERVEKRNQEIKGSGHIFIERNTFDVLKKEVDAFGDDEDFILVNSSGDNYS